MERSHGGGGVIGAHVSVLQKLPLLGSFLVEFAHGFRVKSTSLEIFPGQIFGVSTDELCLQPCFLFDTADPSQWPGVFIQTAQNGCSFRLPGRCPLVTGKGDKLSSRKTLSVRLLG